MARLLLLLWIALLLEGCGILSGVRVETAGVSAKPPSDVAVYVAVEQDGQPVDYLDEGNFFVYENDVLLSGPEVGLRLHPRDETAHGHTVLLLDLSSNPNKQLLARLGRGAAHFVEKVSVTQGVTVLGFDGSPKIRKIGTYNQVVEPTARPLPDLAEFASGDASRDLYGGVLGALAILDEELKKSGKAIRLGTLVVHTQGPDLAGRKSEEEFAKALSASAVEHYAIVPDEASISVIGKLSEDGLFHYASFDELPLRFQDMGMLVRKAWGRYYSLSYCSPARAGTRQLDIVVRYSDAEGVNRSGSGSVEFHADGFSAGCKSKGAERPRIDEKAAPSEATSAGPAELSDQRPAPDAKKPAHAETSPSPSPAPEPATPPREVVAPPTSGKYK